MSRSPWSNFMWTFRCCYVVSYTEFPRTRHQLASGTDFICNNQVYVTTTFLLRNVPWYMYHDIRAPPFKFLFWHPLKNNSQFDSWVPWERRLVFAALMAREIDVNVPASKVTVFVRVWCIFVGNSTVLRYMWRPLCWTWRVYESAPWHPSCFCGEIREDTNLWDFAPSVLEYAQLTRPKIYIMSSRTTFG